MAIVAKLVIGKLGIAQFSPDRKHRYVLTRGPSDGGAGKVLVVMLNPSTATADRNDPSIRKVLHFTDTLYGGAMTLIGNLWAFRATEPKNCFKAKDPVGPANDHFLHKMAEDADHVICAWGRHGKRNGRDEEVLTILRQYHIKLWRFGKPNKDGTPKHPLYLKNSTALEVM